MRGMGKHKRDEHGTLWGDHRCTPEVIWRAALAAIGRRMFDTDAATNPFATLPARTKYMGPRNGLDGLVLPWEGDTWLNFPFSNPMRWVEAAERQANRFRSLTVLGPNDSSTAWHQRLVRFVDARAAWPKRLHFPLPGKPKGSPPGPIALFYSGPQSNAWMRYMRAQGCAVDPGLLDGDRPLNLRRAKKPRRLVDDYLNT